MNICLFMLLITSWETRRLQEGTVTAQDIQWSSLVEDPQYFPYGVPPPYHLPTTYELTIEDFNDIITK